LGRRFPPPWVVEELDACFVVKDSTGQKLAYVYFEDEPGRNCSHAMKRDALLPTWRSSRNFCSAERGGEPHKRETIRGR
jgi:hypothetical protein